MITFAHSNSAMRYRLFVALVSSCLLVPHVDSMPQTNLHKKKSVLEEIHLWVGLEQENSKKLIQQSDHRDVADRKDCIARKIMLNDYITVWKSHFIWSMKCTRSLGWSSSCAITGQRYLVERCHYHLYGLAVASQPNTITMKKSPSYDLWVINYDSSNTLNTHFPIESLQIINMVDPLIILVSLCKLCFVLKNCVFWNKSFFCV